jgi:hypothetical protein
MKLGILVVYLVAEDDAQLLEIHLSQIEKNTTVPYRIYAAANRLLPRFRERIERLPFVKICSISSTDLRGPDEHPYYLERLVRHAIEDGATHICTLHVDSFPVRAGWAEEIAAKLQGNCVLVAAQRDAQIDRKPVTEFMMFTREFYLAQRPAFRIPEHLKSSGEYRRYSVVCPHDPDSGTGYGFAIWAAQLSWLPLPRVDRRGNRHYTGGLYGDLIFHLGGAVVYHAGPEAVTSRQMRVARMLSLFRRMMLPLIPWRIRRRLVYMPGLGPWMVAHFVRPAFEASRTALLTDPEQFLREIRDQS